MGFLEGLTAQWERYGSKSGEVLLDLTPWKSIIFITLHLKKDEVKQIKNNVGIILQIEESGFEISLENEKSIKEKGFFKIRKETEQGQTLHPGGQRRAPGCNVVASTEVLPAHNSTPQVTSCTNSFTFPPLSFF